MEGANRDGFFSGLIPRGRHAEEVASWQYGRQEELSIRIRGGLRDQRPRSEEPYRRIRNRAGGSAVRGGFDESATDGPGRVRDPDDGEVHVVPGDALLTSDLDPCETLANQGGHDSIVLAGENPSLWPYERQDGDSTLSRVRDAHPNSVQDGVGCGGNHGAKSDDPEIGIGDHRSSTLTDGRTPRTHRHGVAVHANVRGRDRKQDPPERIGGDF